MTKIELWKCDICKDVFNSQEECEKHEFTHHLFLWDEDGEAINPQEINDLSCIEYIHWTNKEAIRYLLKKFKESSFFWTYDALSSMKLDNRNEGFVCYRSFENNELWIDYNNLSKTVSRLKNS